MARWCPMFCQVLIDVFRNLGSFGMSFRHTTGRKSYTSHHAPGGKLSHSPHRQHLRDTMIGCPIFPTRNGSKPDNERHIGLAVQQTATT